MNIIQKILVGFDFSRYSENTLKYAAAIAIKFQAELIILNVINKKEIDMILKVADGQFDRNVEKYVEKSADEYVKKVKKNRTRQLEKLISKIHCADLTIHTVFRIGVPFQELIGAIKDEGADLMVMGPKGSTNLADVIFGSNAEKVFRRCPVPLLTVRPVKDSEKK